jgi:hypothetical protein
MILNPGQTSELIDALIDAYDPDRFTLMLGQRLGRHLYNIVMGGAFQTQVAAVVAASEQQGWTIELVKAAHDFNPGADRLKQFHRDFQPVAADAAADPYEAYRLRGDLLFLNRKSLRKALKRLASPTGRRVLLVDGPPSSGKTWTINLIQHVAGHPTKGGFWVHGFDLGDPPDRGPGDLAYDIVLRFAGNLDSMPPQRQASEERWAARLAVWIANQVAQLNVPRYLVFDSFSKFAVPQTTCELIVRLAVLAESEFRHWLRVILLSYSKPLHPQINDCVERDPATLFSTTDAVEFVLSEAKAHGKALDIAAVTQGVQNIWTEYPEGSVYPAGTPGRNQRVIHALRELIEIIQDG